MLSGLAEMEGFEPSKRFHVYMISNHAPSTGLGDISTVDYVAVLNSFYIISQLFLFVKRK